MANKLFNHSLFSNDAKFIQSIHDRFIFDNGIDAEYLPRKIMNRDPILNEPLSSVFDEAISLDMYIHNTEMFFGGNQTLGMNGFSFSFGAASVLVSRNEFIAKVKIDSPHEGDLIFLHPNKMLFEIINVNSKDAIISGGRLFTFEIFIKPYSWGEGYASFDNLNDGNTSSPAIDIIKDMVNKVDESKWDDGCKDDQTSMLDMKENLGLQSQNADFECDSADKIHRDVKSFGFS
uniref:Head closure Hc2 n=1 Tax=Rhizobium phage IG49 TaxID=3129228 RepID=A0AAU8HZB5_9CAUD